MSVHIDYSQNSLPSKNLAKLDDLFADFLMRSRSLNTRDAYKRDLKHFFGFLRAHGNFRSLRDISQRHMAAYRDHMSEHELLSNTTVARRLSSIKRFFDFLMEREICVKNPVQGVSRPKIPLQVKTNDLSNEQVREMMDKIKQHNKNGEYNYSGVLHFTILTIMFHVLLRKSEVLNLNFGDYQSDNVGSYLHVSSKGGKKEKVYISAHVNKVIERYLSIFSKRFDFSEHDPLFTAGIKLSTGGKIKRLNRNTIDMIFKKYSTLAGIEHKISPHSSRATGIGNMYEHGASLEDQATYARHSDPRMTFQYNKRRKEKLGHISSIVTYEAELDH
ncbi:tyrosine-type recombinase/integrase [Bacteriovorax sp. DB6_IX]|uniref:tyrosine-type recombinase/integrase n=1 Tax=Bacteriovorax sp. DB6_IX TaxID=1353530 RepID=UPI00038A3C21|nr:tyrosine-type recombinase/integrase [Bacteriovorax sp. DB6_IX]EQC52626.1 site-specific recombinase, phage integrase family [Bacteriovorax sp. DB6_IX]